MLLSSTSTVETDVSVNPVLAIRDVLVQGRGSPGEKAGVLSIILAEHGVEHSVASAVSRFTMERETIAVYTYINDIPGLWQLPENLARREILYYMIHGRTACSVIMA